MWLWLASQGGIHGAVGEQTVGWFEIAEVLEAKLGIVGRYPMRTLDGFFDSASLLCTEALLGFGGEEGRTR